MISILRFQVNDAPFEYDFSIPENIQGELAIMPVMYFKGLEKALIETMRVYTDQAHGRLPMSDKIEIEIDRPYLP